MESAAILWESGKPQGRVEISNGTLERINIVDGQGMHDGASFAITSDGPCRINVWVKDEYLGWGANATIVHIYTDEHPFSFFLRDASYDYPIYIPQFDVIVSGAEEERSYDEIAEMIRERGTQTVGQRLKSEPEETYENAAAHTKPLHGPIWLGLSRDIRIFDFNDHQDMMWHRIMPRLHGDALTIAELDNKHASYYFYLGRGVGCVDDEHRHLEEGMLPILHGKLVDDDVTYDYTTFVTLETSPLKAENVKGTHFQVAHGHAAGHMFTPEEEEFFKANRAKELEESENTVFWCRVQAVNTSGAPRYAFIKAPFPGGFKNQYDGNTGFAKFEYGGVYMTAKLNGEPAPREEMAILIKPGETVTYDFAIPHSPVSEDRAKAIAAQSFDERHTECRNYWKSKLASAAQLDLPEKVINEMVHAGLLHLDLVAYGSEPAGPVAATIGVYSPIGTESSPIIQFFDSMGWHSLARRSLEYFLDRQRENGFIQNFGNYMGETQAALWSMGEHYRYTRDDEWIRKIAPKLIKSADFLIEWRNRNKREDARGRGYGLIDGKVADPEDPFRYFLANGYAYLAFQRVSEMLANVEPEQSKRYAKEAEEFRNDVRTAFFEATAKSPVVPLGDGTWCPTTPPWAEAPAPSFLIADEYPSFTHGAFTARDSLLGSLYVIFTEILDYNEPAASMLLDYHVDLLHERNVALSQPYYCRHPWAHLKRGEVNAFLKTYYNCVTGLADRETYSFWEHFFYASPHKTHEEGWFLMESRWMLYMEEGDALRLLPGVPRKWLEAGKKIDINNVASYFGPLSFKVVSDVDQGKIRAYVECDTDRKPTRIEFRLPHPLKMKARSVTGGAYNSEKEMVVIDQFSGKAEVVLQF